MAPVIARLPKEDVRVFREAIENDVLIESTGELLKCFTMALRRASIDEVVYEK